MNGRVYNKFELMKKDFEDLRTIDLTSIVSEFKNQFPALFRQVTGLMNCTITDEAYQQAVPRISMVYSIIMFTRNPEMSRLQRVMSCSMVDCLCQQTMYDRYNRFGCCLCYGTSLELFKTIGKEYMDVLIRALGEGKVLRFIIDNIDCMVGVHTETKDKHKHLIHLTGCAALINTRYFDHLPNTPEIPLAELTLEDIIPKPEEYKIVRGEAIKNLIDNTTPYIPSMQFAKEVIPKSYKGPDSYKYINKTQVVPLPVLNYNENCYQDDVKILDHFEDIIAKIHKARGDEPVAYHMGGDQLTRDRLSGAKLLRLGNVDPAARFDHLLPFTMEMLHFGFNFCQRACVDGLFNKNGIAEVGTLKGEVNRTFRSSFNADVIKAYEADKQFILDYNAALQVEAVKHYFTILDVNQGPTQHIPPNFTSKQEKKEWVYKHYGEIVDRYIFPCWTGNDTLPSITTGICLFFFLVFF